MDYASADRKIIETIEKYCREIQKVISLEGVYLFGSYARGTAGDYSDIDLLVVSSDFSGDEIDDTLLLMKLRRKIDRRIEPHPITVIEFDKGNPFLEEIKMECIKVA